MHVSICLYFSNMNVKYTCLPSTVNISIRDLLIPNVRKVSIIVSTPHNMTKAKDSELKEAFKLFDTDGDKMVSVSELKSLITKIGGDLPDAEAEALVKAADVDGNNLIDFKEFSQLWEALHGESGEKIRKDFQRYDLDNSGYITLGNQLQL